MLALAALAVAVVLVAAMAYIRLAPVDLARFHTDPQSTEDPARPNFARISAGEITAASADDLRARVDAAMGVLPRTRLVGDWREDGFATWQTRTLLIGYPDYTTVRILEQVDGTATLSALARARYGYSDMGVNAARLSALRAELAD